jgi:3-hydroxybutyryl-CoA dehydratase
MTGRLYFLEDIEVGTRVESQARTVTEADITNFAGLSGDFSPLHVDEEWARTQTPFKTRIAHGMLVSSISYALRTEVLDSLSLVGWLDVHRRFLKPVFPGDTIHAVWHVTEVRPSKSRPGTGVVKLDIQVTRHDGDVVQDGSDILLINSKTK